MLSKIQNLLFQPIVWLVMGWSLLWSNDEIPRLEWDED